MTEIQYRNRSISQLVSELNTLGEENVLLAPLRLLAIHQKDIPDVKRFKNSHGSQFFIPKNSQKKFAYNQIVQSITSTHLQPLKQFFFRGFNVSIMLCPSRDQGKVTQLLSELGKIVGNCGCSCSSFSEQGIMDIAGGSKINERDFENRLRFYKVMEANIIPVLDKMIRGHAKASINVVKLRSLSQGQLGKNQINLISLPQQFFSANLKPAQFLGSCKSQLTQIFNYLKLNPANKYQHYSKLLTKRMPVTNILASLILQQTAGFIVNWMNEGNLEAIHERLSFYDKMREISVLLKKDEGYMPLLNELPGIFYSPKPQKTFKTKQTKFSKTDRTPIAAFQQQNDLQYCRSLERKTHRYSINDIQLFDQQIQSPVNDSSIQKHYSKTPSPVTHNNFERTSNKTDEIRQFDITVPKRAPFNDGQIKQSEQIAILKANHAIQISQYHQTIQQLNRKILALMNEKDMGQLYSIHEREIMLLQLKIKELRQDVAALCKESDEKTYKGMVRKLNEEIKRLEYKNSEQKVNNGKATMLQKQLKEIRSKYDQSQKARTKLSFQLEHLTKRLKICDSEIEMLNNKQINLKDILSNPTSQNGKLNSLSLSDTQTLKKVEVLLKSIQDGNEQSKSYLIRMITNILTDLTSCRSIILECNDFLVQLQEHLEEKLGIKQPQIVLDCNKFIRNFLMDNLNVF